MGFNRHDFESYPPGKQMDETDINLRAYFALMDESKIAEFDPSWSDEEIIAWDPNFKNDGTLMLICTEREVTAEEYRDVLVMYREFATAAGAAS